MRQQHTAHLLLFNNDKQDNRSIIRDLKSSDNI